MNAGNRTSTFILEVKCPLLGLNRLFKSSTRNCPSIDIRQEMGIANSSVVVFEVESDLPNGTVDASHYAKYPRAVVG